MANDIVKSTLIFELCIAEDVRYVFFFGEGSSAHRVRRHMIVVCGGGLQDWNPSTMDDFTPLFTAEVRQQAAFCVQGCLNCLGAQRDTPMPEAHALSLHMMVAFGRKIEARSGMSLMAEESFVGVASSSECLQLQHLCAKL